MPRMTETPASSPWENWAKAAIEAPISEIDAVAPLARGPRRKTAVAAAGPLAQN